MSVGRGPEDAKPPGEPVRSLTPNVSIRRRYRLAVWITHPIQYQAPLFRKLAQHPQIDLTVYYGSDHGSVDRIDPEFGVSFQWDIPLLEGYRSKFLRNYSWKRTPSGFWWVLNPGIFPELLRHRYDSFLIHGYALATSLLAYAAAWLSDTPVIFRAETVLRPNRPWWLRLAKRLLLPVLFGGTRAFLTIGSRSREFYRAYHVSDDQMFFTPYSVDNEFFSRECKRWKREKLRIKQALGIPDAPVILYAGKLVPRKRPLDLVQAFAGVEVDCALVLVGDGPSRPLLEQYVETQRLKNVFFLGFQNQTALPKFYAISDLLVLPSSAEEVSPLILNEAMACALPVVVSDAVPSAIDFVREGENGFVYPVSDVGTLARRIHQLVADSDLRQAMGRRSLELISGWNYDVCVDAIINALRCSPRVKRWDAAPQPTASS